MKNLGHAIPRGVLKTSGYAFGFQHSPRDLANVNGWKIMFDPYIDTVLGNKCYCICDVKFCVATTTMH